MKKKLVPVLVLLLLVFIAAGFTSCDSTASRKDMDSTLSVADRLQANQPTPTDIEYSTTRYSLDRRAYVLNGMYEKAASLARPLVMPLGYVLFTDAGIPVRVSSVDGPVVSLQTYLTPESEYYEKYTNGNNEWLPDIDGTYGENAQGVFWFDSDGEMQEDNGEYHYFSSMAKLQARLDLLNGDK